MFPLVMDIDVGTRLSVSQVCSGHLREALCGPRLIMRTAQSLNVGAKRRSASLPILIALRGIAPRKNHFSTQNRLFHFHVFDLLRRNRKNVVA